MVHSSEQQALQPSSDVVTGVPEANRPTLAHLPDVLAVRRDMHDRLARIMVRAKAA